MNQKYLDILNILKDDISKVKEELIKGIDIQEPLKTRLLKFLNAPSKHIRPLVSFLYLKAAGCEIDDRQILFQSVVELVHNASLIHDDIIDESSVRRGQKSLNADFGNKISVISGDYLLSVALKKLLKFNMPALIEMFTDTLKTMSKGEIQQQLSRYEIPSLDDYLKKTEQKTAKLFETAVNGCLLIANSSRKTDFGSYFGMAFQIRDDLINAITSNTDLKSGIYTAPVIFAGNTDDIKNGIEKTGDLLNNYKEKAQKELENLSENRYKCALKELINQL